MIAPPDATVLSDDESARIFGGRGQYPWHIYFDGKARWLTLKDHFPNMRSLKVMIDYCRLMARRHKVRVQIRQNTAEGGIHLKALKRGTDAANENVEAIRAKTGKPVRNNKASTQRRKQQKRG